MTTFLRVCLFFFAVCAALGILPASVLAARARQPAMVAGALLIAAFVIYVLIAAALALPRHLPRAGTGQAARR
jgi:hypothetical protein